MSEPEETNGDPTRRDPYVFTTHLGRPVDLSNWTRAWWQPAARAELTRPGEGAVALAPFRLLRAAAITSWLQDGRSLDYCARTAGNSQAVIEKHYRGVLDEVCYDGAEPVLRSRGAVAPTSETAGLDLMALPSDRLVDVQRALADELARRLPGLAR